MTDLIVALIADPWRLLALTMMGTGLVVSGMMAGYRISWVLGINPVIGTYAGLVVSIAGGVAYFTA